MKKITKKILIVVVIILIIVIIILYINSKIPSENKIIKILECKYCSEEIDGPSLIKSKFGATAIPHLRSIIENERTVEVIKGRAYLALGFIDNRESSDILVKGFNDQENSSYIRIRVAMALGMLKNNIFEDWCLAEIKEDKETVRDCLEAIGYLDDWREGTVDKLIEILQDKNYDSHFRKLIVYKFKDKQLDNNEYRLALIEILNQSKEVLLLDEAINELIRLNEKKAINSLLKLLTYADNNIQIKSMKALHDITNNGCYVSAEDKENEKEECINFWKNFF